MAAVDHFRLLVNCRGDILQVQALNIQGHPVAVSPGQKQQLLHKFLHVGCLFFDGVDRFLQRLFVILAPPV
jgi:hypothetical protein